MTDTGREAEDRWDEFRSWLDSDQPQWVRDEADALLDALAAARRAGECKTHSPIQTEGDSPHRPNSAAATRQDSLGSSPSDTSADALAAARRELAATTEALRDAVQAALADRKVCPMCLVSYLPDGFRHEDSCPAALTPEEPK